MTWSGGKFPVRPALGNAAAPATATATPLRLLSTPRRLNTIHDIVLIDVCCLLLTARATSGIHPQLLNRSWSASLDNCPEFNVDRSLRALLPNALLRCQFSP